MAEEPAPADAAQEESAAAIALEDQAAEAVQDGAVLEADRMAEVLAEE